MTSKNRPAARNTEGRLEPEQRAAPSRSLANQLCEYRAARRARGFESRLRRKAVRALARAHRSHSRFRFQGGCECKRQRFDKKPRRFPAIHEASFNTTDILEELFGNFDAAPKGDMIFDGFRRLFRLGVVPGSILIGSIADLDGIVACNALPWTGGVSVAWRKIFPLDRIRWEIVIALDDNGLIRFGNDRIFPDRLHRILSFDYQRLTRYAAKLREHIRIMNLIPIAKARTHQFHSRRPGGSLNDKMLAVKKIL